MHRAGPLDAQKNQSNRVFRLGFHVLLQPTVGRQFAEILGLD
jgi:hypothetical protein